MVYCPSRRSVDLGELQKASGTTQPVAARVSARAPATLTAWPILIQSHSFAAPLRAQSLRAWRGGSQSHVTALDAPLISPARACHLASGSGLSSLVRGVPVYIQRGSVASSNMLQLSSPALRAPPARIGARRSGRALRVVSQDYPKPDLDTANFRRAPESTTPLSFTRDGGASHRQPSCGTTSSRPPPPPRGTSSMRQLNLSPPPPGPKRPPPGRARR